MNITDVRIRLVNNDEKLKAVASITIDNEFVVHDLKVINGKEGFLPYLSDDVYWGFKTLIFDISEATADCAGRIMNGWWSARYDDDKDVHFTNGLWELPLTEAIAKDCARGNGGSGKDLDIMITSGSCQINAVYYEE
jgi:DNA-binding cell septation regulator SpoVG